MFEFTTKAYLFHNFRQTIHVTNLSLPPIVELVLESREHAQVLLYDFLSLLDFLQVILV